MIHLAFTEREIELIQQWYEAVREHSGHWGDGAVTTPDEDIVLHKLEHPGAIELHPHHLELILQWAEVAVHTAVSAEESGLLEKICRALGRDPCGLDLKKPF